MVLRRSDLKFGEVKFFELLEGVCCPSMLSKRRNQVVSL